MKNKNLKEDYLHDCSLFPVYVIKVSLLGVYLLIEGWGWKERVCPVGTL